MRSSTAQQLRLRNSSTEVLAADCPSEGWNARVTVRGIDPFLLDGGATSETESAVSGQVNAGLMPCEEASGISHRRGSGGDKSILVT